MTPFIMYREFSITAIAPLRDLRETFFGGEVYLTDSPRRCRTSINLIVFYQLSYLC